MKCVFLRLITAIVLLDAVKGVPDQSPYIPADPDAPGSRGNKFYVAFMQNVDRDAGRLEPELFILVTTNEPEPVEFTVTTFLNGVDDSNMYTATYGTTTQVAFPADTFYVTDQMQRDRAIRVQAEDGKKISVYAVNDENRSTDGFLALSCDGMTVNNDFRRYDYVILSAEQTGTIDNPQTNSEFLIIPCEDNTRIDITPTQLVVVDAPDFSTPQFGPESISTAQWQNQIDNVRPTAGLTLLISHPNDLTGTHIRGTKPLVVFSGHQCAQVPTGETACDHLVEQIPPHTTWGYTFFLNPLAIRESGDYYRVATVYDNTKVKVNCISEGRNNVEIRVQQTLQGARPENWLEFFTHEPNDGEPCIVPFLRKFCTLESSNPVIVMQYSQGYRVDIACTGSAEAEEFLGDPFMSVVPPVTQYLNNYTTGPVTGVAGPFSVRYINIAVHERFFEPAYIFIDDETAAPFASQWTKFYCSNELEVACGYGIYLRLSNGDHTVYHTDSSAGLGVQYYGFQQENSYGFPLGMELQPTFVTLIACPEEISVSEDDKLLTINCTRLFDESILSRIRVQSQPTNPIQAEANNDYTPVNEEIRYRSRITVVSFDILIVDDDIPECPEAFEITVTPVLNAVVQNSVIRVIILESDGGNCTKIGFVRTTFSAVESDGFVSVEVAVVEGELSGDVVIRVESSDASARITGRVGDYNRVDKELMFSAAVTTIRIDVNITNDRIVEETETFSLQLDLRSVSGQANVALSNDTAIVSILDDDGRISVGFSTDNYETTENSGNVTVCVDVLVPSEFGALRPFTVALLPIQGFDASEDYFLGCNVRLDFERGERRHCYTNYTIRDDSICEPTEFFIVEVIVTTNDRFIDVNSSLSETTVSIDDTAEPECKMSVGFNPTTYESTESSGSVSVCVDVLEPANNGALRPFTVALLIEPDSKVLNDSGLESYVEVDFEIGNQRLCHTYDIFDDIVCETSYNAEEQELGEIFLVNLTLVTTNDSFLEVVSNKSMGRVFINDFAEPECILIVGFTESSYSSTEAEAVEVCVAVLSGELSINITVHLDSLSGTAEEGVDYRGVSIDVTLSPSNSEQCVSVEIVDDSAVEQTESLTVSLSLPPGGLSSVQLTPNTATILITDNDDSIQEESSSLNAGVVSAIVIAALVVVVIGVVVAIIVICCCKTKKLPSNDIAEDSRYEHHYFELDKTRKSSLMQQLHQQVKTKRMIFSKEQIRLSNTVGQGESGLVYKAYLDTAVGSELVAVKTGKALFSTSDIEKLVKEVTTMLSFDHPNVMSLIGVCLDGEMPLLIMPFMSNGSILDYMKHHKEELLLGSEAEEDKIQTTRKQCVGMCHQITKGMKYLAQYKFIHRDLAARNCMIDRNGVIKVADFGLTEETYGTNYYRRDTEAKSDEKVPIRWMAPESIENDIYNESTDVWAFGVTCWEVFTCGRVPYSGIPAMSLLKELHNGQRLEKPSNTACSDEIYDIMVSCWCVDSHQRPRFSDLDSKFSDLLERDAGYLELSRSLSWKKTGASLKEESASAAELHALQSVEEEEEIDEEDEKVGVETVHPVTSQDHTTVNM